MQKQYADAQTIVRAYGAPNVLITKTMSSTAPELAKFLAKGETWADCPDVVARLFIDKLKVLINDLTVKQILGPVAAWFYSVEHQKRLHFAY